MNTCVKDYHKRTIEMPESSAIWQRFDAELQSNMEGALVAEYYIIERLTYYVGRWE